MYETHTLLIHAAPNNARQGLNKAKIAYIAPLANITASDVIVICCYCFCWSVFFVMYFCVISRTYFFSLYVKYIYLCAVVCVCVCVILVPISMNVDNNLIHTRTRSKLKNVVHI